MARRTATDFIQEVRDICGGETSETVSDSRILRIVNEEYKLLCSKYTPVHIETDETVTTTSGTAAYELTATDVLGIERVIDTTNNYTLRELSEYLYHQYTQGDVSSTTGTPVYWFVSGVGSNNRWEITLYPTPDGTYSLTVSLLGFTELVTSPSATSPVIPSAFDNVIVNRAAAQLMRQVGNHDYAYRLLLGANEMEEMAKKTLQSYSYVPIRPKSIISGAARWRD